MLLEVYSGGKYCPTMEKLISDPDRDWETEREREKFEYDQGHSGHSFRAVLGFNWYKYNIRLWRFILLEMLRTGFLQISLRLLLSCLQLVENENI